MNYIIVNKNNRRRNNLVKIILYVVLMQNLVINFVHSQNSLSNENVLKKYLWIQEEYVTRELNNITEISDWLNYFEKIVKSDSSIYKDAKIEYYFKDVNITFYKFITLGRTLDLYISLIGIGDDGSIYEVLDADSVVNKISKGLQLPDSVKFPHLINIYNKVEYLREDVTFFKPGNKVIFKSESIRHFYNNYFRSGNKLCYRKLLQVNYENFVDQYQITYCIDDGLFSVSKYLISRNSY